jgi:DNA polymerase III subunit epsilon
MRQVFLDTETTGLSAQNGDRIIELGCVEMVNRRLTGNNLHLYFNPERDSHEDALRIHGITSEFLKDKPKFETLATHILEYLQGAEILIHNASFDMGFLNKEFERADLPSFASQVGKVVDTVAMAKSLFPGKRNSLDALCDRLGVDRSTRQLHGALLDAQLLADVYLQLTRGQNSLIEEVQQTRLGRSTVTVLDLSQLSLPVISASEQEQMLHESVLVGLDKSSCGSVIWRKANVSLVCD